jgi:hypothetical protein
MRRLFARRSVTAVGIYVSVVLGFLGTIVASREMSLAEFGVYSTVLFAAAFLGGFFDLTVEEALVKYGFRYIAREAQSGLPQRISLQARRDVGRRDRAPLFLVCDPRAAVDGAARLCAPPLRAVARRARRDGALPARAV